jgi:hypothetical protein
MGIRRARFFKSQRGIGGRDGSSRAGWNGRRKWNHDGGLRGAMKRVAQGDWGDTMDWVVTGD